jgi:hypothetical protein
VPFTNAAAETVSLGAESWPPGKAAQELPEEASHALPLPRCWSGPEHRPQVVFHADWSMHPHKRRQAEATLDASGQYLASETQPTASPDRILGALLARALPAASVLAGFDFVIGLPSGYAKRADVSRFLDVFPHLGSGVWEDFFLVADVACEVSIWRPFYPRRAETKGSVTHEQLCAALRVGTMDDLRRQCELETECRSAAEAMFWTLGPKQVGKAVISGWKQMLQPARRGLGDRLRFWPFEGTLDHLLAPGRLAVVETYPAECYTHLGLKVNKRGQPSRQTAGKVLLEWARRAGIRLTTGLERQLLDGFGPSAEGEDDFDAVVGLFGMLNVVLGYRLPGDPTDAAVKETEGWMFGMACPEQSDGARMSDVQRRS